LLNDNEYMWHNFLDGYRDVALLPILPVDLALRHAPPS